MENNILIDEKKLVEDILLGNDVAWKNFLNNYSNTILIQAYYKWCKRSCPNKDMDCNLKCMNIIELSKSENEIKNNTKNVFSTIKMNRDLSDNKQICDDDLGIYEFSLTLYKKGKEVNKEKSSDSSPRLAKFLNFKAKEKTYQGLRGFIILTFFMNIIPEYKEYKYKESGGKDNRYKPKIKIYFPVNIENATKEEKEVFELIQQYKPSNFEQLEILTEKNALNLTSKELQKVYLSLRKQLGKDAWHFLDSIMNNQNNFSTNSNYNDDEEKNISFDIASEENFSKDLENKELWEVYLKAIESLKENSDTKIHYRILKLKFEGLNSRQIADKLAPFGIKNTNDVNNRITTASNIIKEKISHYADKDTWKRFMYDIDNSE